MVMFNNIEDIKSLINHQEKPDIKEINALKMHSSNFSKFIDNSESSNVYIKKKTKALNSLQNG